MASPSTAEDLGIARINVEIFLVDFAEGADQTTGAGPIRDLAKRGEMMEAPVYQGSVEFEQPIAKPYVMRLDNVSIAELMAMPAALDIVLRYLPSLKLILSSPMLKPHMGNMTVHSLDAFVKPSSPDAYALIDEELSRLPPVSEASP